VELALATRITAWAPAEFWSDDSTVATALDLLNAED
jgi:hypothetical protein